MFLASVRPACRAGHVAIRPGFAFVNRPFRNRPFCIRPFCNRPFRQKGLTEQVLVHFDKKDLQRSLQKRHTKGAYAALFSRLVVPEYAFEKRTSKGNQ